MASCPQSEAHLARVTFGRKRREAQSSVRRDRTRATAGKGHHMTIRLEKLKIRRRRSLLKRRARRRSDDRLERSRLSLGHEPHFARRANLPQLIFTPNQKHHLRVLSHMRGVSRSSRTLGWDAMDAAVRRRTQPARGRRNRVVLALRSRCSSWR
jgi:hypothetical protein